MAGVSTGAFLRDSAAPALVAFAVAASQRAGLHSGTTNWRAGHAATEPASWLGRVRTLYPAGLAIRAAFPLFAARHSLAAAFSVAFRLAARTFLAAVASFALTFLIRILAQLDHAVIVKFGCPRALGERYCVLDAREVMRVDAYHDHVEVELLVSHFLGHVAGAVASVVSVTRFEEIRDVERPVRNRIESLHRSASILPRFVVELRNRLGAPRLIRIAFSAAP